MHRIPLRIAATVLATVFSNAALAQICPQSFDGVTAPALPTGWSSAIDDAGTGWTAITTNPDSAPNAAFAADVAAVGSSYLYSPPTVIDSANAVFTFRHLYATESTFDGGVLEISIAGAPYEDIIAAGGAFGGGGGYSATISTAYMSPIAGRQAWSGTSEGYVSTIVHLPAAALGAEATLRWRMASDQSVGATGWSIDSIACGEVHDSEPWQYVTPYPIPIMDQTTTAMDGALYSFAGVSAGAIIAAAYKYEDSAWTQIASLPVALEYPVAVNDGTYIYILGGSGSDGVPVSTMYRYNPQTNGYQVMAPSAVATWGAAAVVVGDKIVKFGGKVVNAGVSGESDATEVYDIGTNTWSVGTAYPHALGFVSAFVHGGYAYGAGGIGGNPPIAYPTTYRYDVMTNVWDDASITELPDLRWGAATIELPGGVLLAGGYVGGGAAANLSPSAIFWNASSDSWTSFPPLRSARARMTGALSRGQPLVIGGRPTAGGFSGTIEVQAFDRLFADGFDPVD
jgi:N-acetylneuraminic acid mutarotase